MITDKFSNGTVSRGNIGWVSEALAVDNWSQGEIIDSPEAAAEVIVPALVGMDREVCLLVTLTTKHALIASHIVSVGSIDKTFMSPREIYRQAIIDNAAAIVVAHNHPSGDPEPSNEDRKVSRRLNTAGEMLGVELLDHLVVGGDRWVSLARRGAIQ